MTIQVFLVDDHTIVRDGLAAVIKSHRNIHVVGMASDGVEALKQVKELKPDVVLMDISMPNLNGIEATKKIIESCPNTRVIILSMHNDPERIYRSLKAGAKGVLIEGIRRPGGHTSHSPGS